MMDWFVFLGLCHINLHGLFNAKAILGEEHLWVLFNPKVGVG